jgi:hypothetical protein
MSNATSQSARLFINKDLFAGVFPHKGEKSVRLQMPNGKTRWAPVRGRTVTVASAIRISPKYLPLGVCDPESIRGATSWAGMSGPKGERFVWINDAKDGVRLALPWKAICCSGPDLRRVIVPAGSRVWLGNTGSAEDAGFVWVQ